MLMVTVTTDEGTYNFTIDGPTRQRMIETLNYCRKKKLPLLVNGKKLAPGIPQSWNVAEG